MELIATRSGWLDNVYIEKGGTYVLPDTMKTKIEEFNKTTNDKKIMETKK